MSAERRYLDSSALVKLVVDETQSRALEAHLSRGPSEASCGLAHVEVIRAVRPAGQQAVTYARTLLSDIDILAVDGALLDAAADLPDERLRSLDAVHVAAALSLGDDLAELITYDRAMAAAAEGFGLRVSSPSDPLA